MGVLSKLVAGDVANYSYQGDFSNAVIALEKSINEHASELSTHWKAPANSDTRVFTSCARLLLEQCCAVLLGRFDPIRLVTVIKGSSSADFKIGFRNSSSFIWSKDVLPDIKPGSGYWTQESIGKGIHRALLEGHLADYVFTSAHGEVIDEVTDSTNKQPRLAAWVIELLKVERGEAVLAKLRSETSEAYSTLSKGIHFEFFLGKETRPTTEEVQRATSKAMTAVATVALYSHFSDISILKIDKPTAIDSFLQIIDEFQYHG